VNEIGTARGTRIGADFRNREELSASMFQFLGENLVCNLAMQNRMAAMRKVAREQVRYKAKRSITGSASAGHLNWIRGAPNAQV
jgi:hypothetical protein